MLPEIIISSYVKLIYEEFHAYFRGILHTNL